MNIGVEVLKESVIRVQSQLNEGMDCVFVVSNDYEEKAKEVLEKAWDSFWEDGDGWCYGNYLEDKLVNAGIAFDAYYADAEEYRRSWTYRHSDVWTSWNMSCGTRSRTTWFSSVSERRTMNRTGRQLRRCRKAF